jgi:hypothetical protein
MKAHMLTGNFQGVIDNLIEPIRETNYIDYLGQNDLVYLCPTVRSFGRRNFKKFCPIKEGIPDAATASSPEVTESGNWISLCPAFFDTITLSLEESAEKWKVPKNGKLISLVLAKGLSYYTKPSI